MATTFESLMADLAKSSPGMSLGTAYAAVLEELEDLNLAGDGKPVSTGMHEEGFYQLYDHDEMVKYAQTLPELMEHMAAGMKIQAIKVLRFGLSCGLKDAKDAVECIPAYKTNSYYTSCTTNH